MILSVITAVLEKVVKNIIMLMSKSGRRNAIFVKRNNTGEELRMRRGRARRRRRGGVDEGRLEDQ